MIGVFYSLINRRGKLDPACKLKLDKTIIRPSLLYASAAWATAATCHMRRLQVVENRILRMTLDRPWFVRNTILHQDTGLATIEDYIKSTAGNFFERAAQHENPLIDEAINYDPTIQWRYKRPRMVLNDP